MEIKLSGLCLQGQQNKSLSHSIHQHLHVRFNFFRPCIGNHGYMQGLIQWGARGAMPPPSWDKMPQILGQMPSKSRQNAPICTKVPHKFGQNALYLSPKCPGFAQEQPQMHHLGGKFSEFAGGRPPHSLI